MARVLVVEDDAWIAWMIADDLADRGYQVSTARDGAEALRRLETARPDAMVLDLMLPRMNGWEFVERYQERTAGRVIPIVVVSAAGAVPRSLERRGVRQFLPKPFDVEQLARSVAEAVVSADASGSSATAAPGLAPLGPQAAAGTRRGGAASCDPVPDHRSQRTRQRTRLPKELLLVVTARLGFSCGSWPPDPGVSCPGVATPPAGPRRRGEVRAHALHPGYSRGNRVWRRLS